MSGVEEDSLIAHTQPGDDDNDGDSDDDDDASPGLVPAEDALRCVFEATDDWEIRLKEVTKLFLERDNALREATEKVKVLEGRVEERNHESSTVRRSIVLMKRQSEQELLNLENEMEELHRKLRCHVGQDEDSNESLPTDSLQARLDSALAENTALRSKMGRVQMHRLVAGKDEACARAIEQQAIAERLASERKRLQNTFMRFTARTFSGDSHTHQKRPNPTIWTDQLTSSVGKPLEAVQEAGEEEGKEKEGEEEDVEKGLLREKLAEAEDERVQFTKSMKQLNDTIEMLLMGNKRLSAHLKELQEKQRKGNAISKPAAKKHPNTLSIPRPPSPSPRSPARGFNSGRLSPVSKSVQPREQAASPAPRLTTTSIRTPGDSGAKSASTTCTPTSRPSRLKSPAPKKASISPPKSKSASAASVHETKPAVHKEEGRKRTKPTLLSKLKQPSSCETPVGAAVQSPKATPLPPTVARTTSRILLIEEVPSTLPSVPHLDRFYRQFLQSLQGDLAGTKSELEEVRSQARIACESTLSKAKREREMLCDVIQKASEALMWLERLQDAFYLAAVDSTLTEDRRRSVFLREFRRFLASCSDPSEGVDDSADRGPLLEDPSLLSLKGFVNEFQSGKHDIEEGMKVAMEMVNSESARLQAAERQQAFLDKLISEIVSPDYFHASKPVVSDTQTSLDDYWRMTNIPMWDLKGLFAVIDKQQEPASPLNAEEGRENRKETFNSLFLQALSKSTAEQEEAWDQFTMIEDNVNNEAVASISFLEREIQSLKHHVQHEVVTVPHKPKDHGHSLMDGPPAKPVTRQDSSEQARAQLSHDIETWGEMVVHDRDTLRTERDTLLHELLELVCQIRRQEDERQQFYLGSLPSTLEFLEACCGDLKDVERSVSWVPLPVCDGADSRCTPRAAVELLKETRGVVHTNVSMLLEWFLHIVKKCLGWMEQNSRDRDHTEQLEGQLANAQLVIQEMEAKVAEVSIQLFDLERARTQAEDELSAAKRELHTVKKEKDFWEAKIEEDVPKLAALETKERESAETQKALEEETRVLRSEVETLQFQVEELQAERDADRDSATLSYHKENTRLREELSAMQKELDAASMELPVLRKMLSDMEAGQICEHDKRKREKGGKAQEEQLDKLMTESDEFREQLEVLQSASVHALRKASEKILTHAESDKALAGAQKGLGDVKKQLSGLVLRIEEERETFASSDTQTAPMKPKLRDLFTHMQRGIEMLQVDTHLAERIVEFVVDRWNQALLAASTPMKLAPKWVPDLATRDCSTCHQMFGGLSRRHHCRHCGRIFCHRCSNKTAQLPMVGEEKAVRVCDECYIMLCRIFP